MKIDNNNSQQQALEATMQPAVIRDNDMGMVRKLPYFPKPDYRLPFPGSQLPRPSLPPYGQINKIIESTLGLVRGIVDSFTKILGGLMDKLGAMSPQQPGAPTEPGMPTDPAAPTEPGMPGTDPAAPADPSQPGAGGAAGGGAAGGGASAGGAEGTGAAGGADAAGGNSAAGEAKADTEALDQPFNAEGFRDTLAEMFPRLEGKTINEERLQFGAAAHMIRQEKGEEAYKEFVSNVREMRKSGDVKSLEAATRRTLRKMVNSGDLSAKEGRQIYGVSFRAAQLDNNKKELYDGRGETQAKADFDKAANSVTDYLTAIENDEKKIRGKKLKRR